MNREIKFRGITISEPHFVYGTPRIFKSGRAEIFDMENTFYVKPETISQFTGIKDKNGKEIYEGDIIKCHYFYQALGEGLGVYEAEKEIIGEITFQELGLWIQCDEENDCGYLSWISGLHEESFEIIENITKT